MTSGESIRLDALEEDIPTNVPEVALTLHDLAYEDYMEHGMQVVPYVRECERVDKFGEYLCSLFTPDDFKEN